MRRTDQIRLRREIMSLFDKTDFDFRRTNSIVRDMAHLGAGRADVVGVLDELFREKVIRHPVAFSTTELEWWRLIDRGYTRGEKWRMIKALIGMYPVSNGEFNGGDY